MTIATVSPRALREAMGAFPTGVTVVTTVGAGGEPVGTTANAVTSLSLEPPLLLVCFARESRTLAAIGAHGGFAVNVLGARDRHLSAAFARSGAADAWEELEYSAGPSGSPCFARALAHLDCALERRLPGGDHEILVGRVLHATTGAEDEPLIFHRGRYTSVVAAADAAAGEVAAPDEVAAAQAVAAAPSAGVAGSAERAHAGVIARLPTPLGDLRIAAGDGGLVALVHGDPAAAGRAVVRIHRACLLGDTLRSLACDCRDRLDAALGAVRGAPAGVLLYSRDSGTLGDHGPVAVDGARAARLLRRAGVRAAAVAPDDVALARALSAHRIDVVHEEAA
jgi:flavin reductase (DIM6/NTAB) family NADH-FMN oxidoreductase RutF